MMKLDKIQNLLGYKFKNETLLINALTHKSCKKKHSNERLEFLGDAVMDLIVAEYLCNKFKDMNEGDLSKLRAALVNEKSFAALASLIDLQNHIILSSAEENNKGRQKPSLLSDAFEAIMGAIYIESGIEKAKEVAINLLKKEYENINLKTISKDYKTRLQEITQATYGKTPQYVLISSKGPDHKKEFTMALMLDNKEISSASGTSKKEAEQNAAKLAIEILSKGKK
ncbi:ribonuclease III [Campylobacter sputorum]|uniref:ribonuclease III n=1 Tax=Campylobacter sputorum TaxID=206 RepID=UPI001911B8D6|nr:ribonuclease III [Campylobacter sputorum]